MTLSSHWRRKYRYFHRPQHVYVCMISQCMISQCMISHLATVFHGIQGNIRPVSFLPLSFVLSEGEFRTGRIPNCVANSRRSENFVRFFFLFFFFVELPNEDYFEVDISNSGVGDVYVWIFKIGILKFHVIRCCGKNSLWMIKDVKIREHFASEVFKIIRYNRYTTTF